MRPTKNNPRPTSSASPINVRCASMDSECPWGNSRTLSASGRRPRTFVAYPLALLVSVIITIGWSGFASADVKYTYTGKPFVHFFPPGACTAGGGECMISGFFTLATPIPANVTGFTVDCRLTGFSFTDGVNTITLADLPKPCGNSLVVVSTDATGQITHETAPGFDADRDKLFDELRVQPGPTRRPLLAEM